jgi:hypothetical protein
MDAEESSAEIIGNPIARPQQEIEASEEHDLDLISGLSSLPDGFENLEPWSRSLVDALQDLRRRQGPESGASFEGRVTAVVASLTEAPPVRASPSARFFRGLYRWMHDACMPGRLSLFSSSSFCF